MKTHIIFTILTFIFGPSLYATYAEELEENIQGTLVKVEEDTGQPVDSFNLY